MNSCGSGESAKTVSGNYVLHICFGLLPIQRGQDDQRVDVPDGRAETIALNRGGDMSLNVPLAGPLPNFGKWRDERLEFQPWANV